VARYLGEIRLFAGNFDPVGWEFCNGQMLQISEHGNLFDLIGTMYGGDGQDTFALPDLRGRVPLHQGSNGGNTFQIAEQAGSESVTLTTQQLPVHTHPFVAAAAAGDQTSPLGNVPANSFNVTPYINQAPDGNMSAAAIAPAGGTQPHENRQPFLCINFIISTVGVFPSQT
jgi:microcystin-dependent protein